MANKDWWANKLGSTQPARQSPPTGPNPNVPYTPPVQQPNVRVGYDSDNDQLVTKAVSAKTSNLCPNCNSGNYFAPQGTQRMRCYDCGYPIVQQGSGLASSGGSGPATPAIQRGQGNGFNPGTIVDRIG